MLECTNLDVRICFCAFLEQIPTLSESTEQTAGVAGGGGTQAIHKDPSVHAKFEVSECCDCEGVDRNRGIKSA